MNLATRGPLYTCLVVIFYLLFKTIFVVFCYFLLSYMSCLILLLIGDDQVASIQLMSNFTRVRLDMKKMSIVVSDAIFATEDMLTFGRPILCQPGKCLFGQARIDLRGTPFQLKVLYS